MENQHRKITGYRELSQEEIDLMNEIKALGPIIEDKLESIRIYIINKKIKALEIVNNQEVSTVEEIQEANEFLDRDREATPGRFVALAKTDFQTALMYLTRAVAQPTFF